MPNAPTWKIRPYVSKRSTRQRQSRTFVAAVQLLEERVVLSPPTIPGTPSLTGLSANSATISWGASTDNVALSGYSVYWIYTTGHSGRGGGYTTHTILEATTNGSTTTATISGLTQNKSYTFYVKASDVAGYSSGYSTPVNVIPGAAPYGFTAAEAGVTGYSFSIVAKHQLNLQLSAKSFSPPTYSVVNPPAGMIVNPVTGAVSWTPNASNVGTTSVTFDATNQFGTTALTVPITITADVPVPSFVFTNTSSPTLNVVGFPIGLQMTDASNTPSTFTVVSAPANVSIDPVSGVVNWTPTPDQVGNAPLTFQLTNSAGTASITVNPVIYVSDAPQNVNVTNLNSQAPVLNWSPPVYNDNLVAGYRVMVYGPDYLNYTFTTDAATLSASLAGVTVTPGTYGVNMQAIDANGNQGLWASISFDYNPTLPNPTYAFTSNGGGAYAVPGQQASIQLTDSVALPDTFSLISGPAGMIVDPTQGVVTWTPGLLDLGESDPIIAVTNSVGTTYVTLVIPVLYATPVNNVTASFSNGGNLINVGWTDPTVASEPIAGEDLYLSWINDSGYLQTTFEAFVPYGTYSYSLGNLPGDVGTLYVTLVAVDYSGNEGAYPLSSTKVTGGGGG